MFCLGIESSCDETALAIVDDGRVIGNVLASQIDLHSIFGGVVPELASREHYRFIGPLFDQLLDRCKIDAGSIDVIAVARGPGLLGSLLVGVAFAKGLAWSLDRPVVGVNHLHAHLLACGLEHELKYPALGLLASGGHTRLYRIESPWNFIQLGRSLDDAAGEAYDKTGYALGLSYPAGAAIDNLACAGNPDNAVLPRPYLDNENLDFSFSGLKTAAANHIERHGIRGDKAKTQDFCASFNLAMADTLNAKLSRALAREKGIHQIWLAGGVAANSMIRVRVSALAAANNLEFLVPSPSLCTDNAVMIAYSGWLLAKNGFRHSLDMETFPRGVSIPDDLEREEGSDFLDRAPLGK